MYYTLEVGVGTSSVLRNLIDNLKVVCTDENFLYEEALGVDIKIKYVISKSETCLVESYLLYYLARLHRKTKCYR